MKVSNSKGIANHADPESCVCTRKVAGEALTGGRAGQVLSRESKNKLRGADVVVGPEGNMEAIVIARSFTPPRGPRPCARMEVTHTGAGRSRFRPWVMAQGPRCESERSTTAMYGNGKSDRSIVAEKRSNKEGGALSSAEGVEPSGLTKGNTLR